MGNALSFAGSFNTGKSATITSEDQARKSEHEVATVTSSFES
jgi:hypothetical protein